MGNSQAEVEAKLQLLRAMTSSDFSALAWVERGGQNIRWIYAVGNENERYKQMLGRTGRCLAGTVVRIGRQLVLDAAISDTHEKRLKYPIMLAENLHSAVATPVIINGETRGVVLIGSRSSRIYSQMDLQIIKSAADQMVLIWGELVIH